MTQQTHRCPASLHVVTYEGRPAIAATYEAQVRDSEPVTCREVIVLSPEDARALGRRLLRVAEVGT